VTHDTSEDRAHAAHAAGFGRRDRDGYDRGMETAERADIRRLIGKAEADPDVLALLLFGSRARGDASSGSDVDVCIVLEPGRPSGDGGRKRLDYLAEADVDLVVFQQLPLAIRSRVLREGRVLFVRDEDRLYETAVRAARAFEGFRHHHRGYLDAVARD